MENTTIIYTTTDTLVMKYDSEVIVNKNKNEFSIYRMNGNWDVYELIDFDTVIQGDQFELFATVGKYIRTDWTG